MVKDNSFEKVIQSKKGVHAGLVFEIQPIIQGRGGAFSRFFTTFQFWYFEAEMNTKCYS